MDKFKKVKVIGNVIGFNMYTFGEKETYNVQFPDMTVAELESYQFEDADAYHTNGKPLCLRNVLARLRELPEHDREVWLKGIMDEFELDFSHAKWREGYEQGKFDGAVEAEKSNKVVIPQFVADWVEKSKTVAARTLKGAYINAPEKVRLWWSGDNVANVQLFARAWLDGYEVEREKRYVVTDGNHLHLKEYKDVGIIAISNKISESTRYIKKFENKDEAQKIADVLKWKVQEVE